LRKQEKNTGYFTIDYQPHMYSVQHRIPSAVGGKTQLTNLVWQILAR